MSRKNSKRHITLADIAASAGVTPMTVSRVVNESGYVHTDTREKVLRVLGEMNYRRNSLARGLKRQRTDTVGLVLGDVANPFAAELSRGVREVLLARGYTVFICISEHNVREDLAAFDTLADHRVDGLIVATRASKQSNERLEQMVDAGMPTVALGRDFRHPQADFVSADHRRGGLLATMHLIELGHTRIGFVGVSPAKGAGLKRFQGYCSALRKRGLPVDDELIVGADAAPDETDNAPGYSTEAVGFESMKKLLALKRPPTAVFARNDFTALGAMSAIKKHGLRIPHDIAVVGFDDVPFATHTSPPLTTVRQPTREQGRIAAEFLLRRIERDEPLPREERVLPCELIVRESTVAAQPAAASRKSK
ncbi:MAG: LacI family DNA-binding transcriptional regulator [Pyrinomonadaceae bacterium]